jgi:hypothetical protein
MLRRIGVAATTVVGALAAAGPAWAATGDTGSLEGTVVDALTGKPVATAEIVIEMPDYSNWHETHTDDSGHFSIEVATVGGYRVEILSNGYVTQWANGHTSENDADLIAVPGSLQVSLMPIQYGSISGRVVTDGGKPVGIIGIEADDSNGNQVAWTGSGKNGTFTFAGLQTGNYLLGFHYPSGYIRWYRDAADRYSATPVEVKPNVSTALRVVQPAFGSMAIVVKDAGTGAALQGACFYYQGGPFNFNTACTNNAGKAQVTGIPVGTYQVGVAGPNPDWLGDSVSGILVTERHTTPTSVMLKKAAAIHMSFVDAVTGDSVDGGVCVGITGAADHNIGAPYTCDNDDTVDLVGLPPSTVRLFVEPRDGVHGSQWVGPNGGTGDPDAAMAYTVTNGQSVDVTVRLDGAGSISGMVTAQDTGAPVRAVCPTATQPSRSYNPAFNSVCTDSDGTYTIRELGPYDWKVAYPAYGGGQAWVWSGGAPNRAGSTAVRVVAGSTVTADASLPATGRITGKITVPDGGSVDVASIWTVDAETGDYAGVEPPIKSDGTFTINGLNDQSVWLYYTYGGRDITYKYPTEITTTAGGAVSGVDFTVPAS